MRPHRCAFLLGAALALAACGRDAEAAAGSTRTSTTRVHVDADGDALVESTVETSGPSTIRVSGVLLTVEPGVRFVQRTTSAGGVSTSSRTISGHPFGVTGGRFHIGSSDYGKVRDGDRVEVTVDGVRINDERRGSLPAPLEEERGAASGPRRPPQFGVFWGDPPRSRPGASVQVADLE